MIYLALFHHYSPFYEVQVTESGLYLAWWLGYRYTGMQTIHSPHRAFPSPTGSGLRPGRGGGSKSLQMITHKEIESWL